jgi:hypothetical protein
MLIVTSASAMFRRPELQQIPAERLIRNVSAYVARHPHDPEGFYLLGRLNYLAFSQSTDQFHDAVDAKLGDAEHLSELTRSFGASYPIAGELSGKRRLEFLRNALRNLRNAVEMKPGEGLFWLTLGSAIRDGAPFAIDEPREFDAPVGSSGLDGTGPEEDLVSKLASADPSARDHAVSTLSAKSCQTWLGSLHKLMKSKVMTHEGSRDAVAKLLGTCWTEQAIAAFATAYAESKPTNGALRTMSFGRAPVDVEAGEAWIALVKLRGVKPEEEKRIAEIQEYIGTVKRRRGPMTPIIMALDARHPLAELVSQTSVRFDLEGSERRDLWTWVQPTTGILVWDAAGEGHVTNGHQLLGAVAFHMFWRDGYAALDALDDDRDGALTGAELHGLALWFDRNGNGISDAGEVVPVEQLGIVRLSARTTGRDGNTPMNSAGVKLRSGQVLPTYDWLAQPVTELAGNR